MKKRIISFLLSVVMALSLLPMSAMAATTNGKKIYLSPSDQTANSYAYGNTTEAIQCRRIADALEIALKRNGFQVKNNKTSSMAARVEESDAWGADLHVPLHTNAYNGKVGGTRIFAFNTTGEGWKCAKKVYNYLAPLSPGDSDNMSVAADLYEIKYPSAPTVYIESEFHDVPEIAKWIINNVDAIAEAICHGICDYFGVTYKSPEPPAPVLNAPVITIGNTASTGNVHIEWPAVDGAAKYEIWRATSSSGTYTKMYTTANTTYTNTSGTVGTVYYYKVRALDVDGNPGTFSAAKSRCVDCARPVVTATADNDRQRINLQWAAVTGATMYDIYRAKGDSTTYEMIASTTDTLYYDNDVTPDVKYSYKLIAQCGVDAGKSAYSAVVSATVTPPPAPEKSEQTITASTVNATYGDTDKKITASTNGDGALSYKVTSGTDVVSVDKNGKLTILKAGTASVTITAAETDAYKSATKKVSVKVAAKTAEITWSDTEFTYDGTEKQPVATVNNLKNGDECIVTVEGAGVNAGDYTATATTLSNSNYQLPADTETAFRIEKAAPECMPPSGLTANYGSKLSDVTLPEGWQWTDAAASVGSVGDHTFKAVFTPADTDNYITMEQDITVTVMANNQSVTADDVNATYGDTDKSIAALTDGDGTLTYEVIDGKDVVSVDGNGKLVILKAGTATIRITASATDGYNMATKDVTITIAPAQQHITASDVNATVGDTDKAIIASTDGDGTLRYEVIDGKDIVSVNTNGELTILDAGTATVKITADATTNYQQATQNITITVAEAEPVTPVDPEPEQPEEPEQDAVQLGKPVLTMGNDPATGGVLVKWKAIENADYYLVYRSEDLKKPFEKLDAIVEGTEYLDNDGQVGQSYYYKVIACSRDDKHFIASEPSRELARRFDCARPDLTATTEDGKSISLNWNAVDGATRYIVYRSTKPTSGFVSVYSGTNTQHLDAKSLKSGKTYYYRVIARGASAETNSAYSDVIGMTIK